MLAATLVFGGGVATVIVPIGLGATAISATILGHHLLVYSVGGVAMIVGGLATRRRGSFVGDPGRGPVGCCGRSGRNSGLAGMLCAEHCCSGGGSSCAVATARGTGANGRSVSREDGR